MTEDNKGKWLRPLGSTGLTVSAACAGGSGIAGNASARSIWSRMPSFQCSRWICQIPRPISSASMTNVLMPGTSRRRAGLCAALISAVP